MTFGALGGTLPLRLGGTAENGWTARQHARFCGDLVAVKRTARLASWSFQKLGDNVTISGYTGQNGVGAAHAPVASLIDEGGQVGVLFTWPGTLLTDPRNPNRAIPFVVKAASATSQGIRIMQCVLTGNGVAVFAQTAAGGGVDENGAVSVWGTFGELPAVGDYGGDLDKEDSDTEGETPYAAAVLSQIQRDRGTAYTTQPNTLVDAENLALARFLAATGPRTAEKLRANATPRRSDERLEYWQRVLRVPGRAGEPRWRLRKRLANAYRVPLGATPDNLSQELQGLLGSAYVDHEWARGASLDSPPPQTFWPVVNPGDPSLSLGGGAWTSSRAHLVVTVQQPAGTSVGEFLQLVDVELFQLLDSLLPAWATFSWVNTASSSGFYLDVSMLNLTALTEA